MRISANGIQLIKKFEGCRLNAYFDAAGVPTIGYGHTGVDVVPGLVWSQQRADDMLVHDLVKFETKVIEYDPVYHWKQNEFDALVSFAYNIGSIKDLTANGTRNRTEIIMHWTLYRKAGGKILNGLVNRRCEELRLFMQV